MARVPLGTTGGRMPEVGLGLERERGAEKRQKRGIEATRENLMTQIMVQQQSIAAQQDLRQRESDKRLAMQVMKQLQQSQLDKDKLESLNRRFDDQLESANTKFLISEVLDADRAERERADRSRRFSREVMGREAALAHKYGVRWNPEVGDGGGFEAIPTEELPPGVSPGGLEAAAEARKGEAVKARQLRLGLTPYQQESFRRKDIGTIRTQMGNHERRIYDMQSDIDRLEKGRIDTWAMGNPEYMTYTDMRINSMKHDINQRRTELRRMADVASALEVGANSVPTWLTVKSTSTLGRFLEALKALKSSDDPGDVAKLEAVKAQGYDMDQLMRLTETMIRNRRSSAALAEVQ